MKIFIITNTDDDDNPGCLWLLIAAFPVGMVIFLVHRIIELVMP